MNWERRSIGSVGIVLGDLSGCVQIMASGGAIYLHGSKEEISAFGQEIIAAADAMPDAEEIQKLAQPSDEEVPA